MGESTRATGASIDQAARIASRWGPPALAHALPRRRLFRRLEDALRHPCAWVQAPGGYGKTCLLAAYLAERSAPSFWYALDEGDSDAAAFFTDFGEAARGSGLQPQVAFSSEVQAIGHFGRKYFHWLAAAAPERSILVLDDYHRISPDSRLHEAIAAGLEHLPDSLRLVVLSREAPPPAFARAISHLEIGLIGPEAMALSDEEALSIAHRMRDRPLSDDAILSACRAVGGWSAGFVLLLRQTDASALAPGSVDTLAKYFEHEVLRPAPEPIRELLWQTAIFPAMTAPMVEALTGRPDAAAVLRELAGANYFVAVSHGPDAVYRYHDLFRDYLIEHGRRSHPKRWPQVAQRGARLLAEHADPESAAVILTGLRDWAGLVALVMQQAPQLLQRGSYQTLERWISALPDDMKEGDPWLLYWSACAQLATNPPQARATLQRAFSMFAAAEDLQGALLAWAATAQAFLLAFDDFRTLEDWLAELRAILPEQTPIPDELEALIAPGVFLCLIVSQPSAPELGRWEQILFRLLESGCDPNLRATAATLLVLHFAYTIGDRARSLRLRDMLAAPQPLDQMAPVSLTMLRCFTDIVIQYSFGEPTIHTLDSLNSARKLIESLGIGLYDASLCGALAYCHLTNGDTAKARDALDEMGRVLNWQRTWDAGFYLEMRSWEAWLSGRFLEASELAVETLGLQDRFGMLHPRPLAHIAMVQTAHALGRRAQALRHLAAVRHWTRATGSRVGGIMRGITLAQLAMESGRRRRVRQVLEVTFALAQVEGYMVSHFFRREDLSALCTEALDADIATQYVLRIIRGRELLPPARMEDAERWP